MSVKKISQIQPELFEFNSENLIRAQNEIKKYPKEKKASAVLALLYLAQNQHDNWIPLSAIKYVSKLLDIPYIKVYEVVTFYSMFNLSPVGKYFIQVCTTTPCMINGAKKTIVEFKDPMVVKEIRQDGRTVGRLQMDAEVLKYSDADDGHDLALLRIRKHNFVTDTVTFYLDEKIPGLGTDLLHVGSLLGQMGANSMTDGIYSQHGRLIKSLNKFVFDQTTCTAFPGSSGGGVYLKNNASYVGMLVRGAGEGFNLIVPVRRMKDYCERHKIMWALDPKVDMPSEEDLNKLPIEHTPKKKKEEAEDEEGADDKKISIRKEFPFMIRITDKQGRPIKIEER